ncbi:TPA: hypothetical protein ACGZ99_003648 [Elizabethkingia anophelis]
MKKKGLPLAAHKFTYVPPAIKVIHVEMKCGVTANSDMVISKAIESFIK